MISNSFLEKYILSNIIPQSEIGKIANLSSTIGDNKEYINKIASVFSKKTIDSISDFDKNYTVISNFENQKLYTIAKTQRILLAKERVQNLDEISYQKNILVTSNPFASSIHEFEFDEIAYATDDIISTYLPSNLNLKEKYTEKEANNYIDQILELAVNKKASDIHIKSTNRNYSVKLRIATRMTDSLDTRPIEFMDVVFKILRYRCNIDNTSIVKRLKGNFKSIVNNKEYSWRFQLVQTAIGHYKVTIRKSHDFGTNIDINKLNYYPKVLNLIKSTMLIDRGMILICGATGSGKTTILYNVLYLLSTVHKKEVNTLEDPVEFLFDEFTQTQISNDYNYLDGIEDALRSNPDVLLVGEIRNNETAIAAYNAAITGHKTYSTLHVGSIFLVPKRLTSLGLDLDTVLQNTPAIFIQRKVDKLCSCKTFNTKTGFFEANTSIDNHCPICSKTDTKGYDSIVPINEVAIISDNATEFSSKHFKDYIGFKECLDYQLKIGNIDKNTYDNEIIKINEQSSEDSENFKTRFEDKKRKVNNLKLKASHVE